MKLKIALIIILITAGTLGAAVLFLHRHRAKSEAEGFTGSSGCRRCHKTFYDKWSGSWHGLAMRPFTIAFARENLSVQKAPVDIQRRSYWIEIGKDQGVVHERGPGGEKTYPIEHVLGGKNVFFFLTPRPGGKLQVLPLAFDSRKKEWYDTTGSMVRHLPGLGDEPLDWTERSLTFNTSCYTCHFSQLSKNYSIETDSYRTTWGEPGINCESCHGPGRKHVEAMRRTDRSAEIRSPEIIVPRQFSTAQVNSMCAPCHAKMSELDTGFQSGDRFFDHYNLVGLEDRDFYPDGRDLGENFTYTSWLIGPCAASGQLDCLHCHTSSGRNRFAGADADKACLPCHARLVQDPAGHSHHKADSEGSRCVYCHMPETAFARMRRHDHSMLPPTPAATLRFSSPNACNVCHKDRDARWADQWVRRWYPDDYQARLLRRATLIEQARKEDWTRLDEMTSYLTSPDRNEVFATSLLRLLERCQAPQKWPALLGALHDPSPLVRSSAVSGLAGCPNPQVLAKLVEAAGDEYKVVRVHAASMLARFSLDALDAGQRRRIEAASAEFEDSMRCRPDDPRSHYNLGNYFQERGDPTTARREYETALRLLPSLVPALVNLSVVQARLGEAAGAERVLREALRYEPSSAEANFNLGLLLAEQNQTAEAETCLRAALKTDPDLAEAAYNLAVLIADKQPGETISLCRKAVTLRPNEAKYAYTLGFYLRRSGDTRGAIAVLEAVRPQEGNHIDALKLLGSLYEETGRRNEAIRLYRHAIANQAMPAQVRQQFESMITALESR
ncbi:MAG TPA: tetratricopeptide repeat protein [Acidobacteriota bacterium]|nr:tetratricopeptide repeat protein [Acidobacteriota bacterium]